MDTPATLETDRPADQGFAGTTPQPVDRVLASLIQDNYDRAGQRQGKPPIDRPLPAGWTRMDDDALRAAGIDPALQQDRKSGFDASFYRDASGKVALVFAGSDEGRDWKHNFGQGLGFRDAQYDQAIALTRQSKLAFGDNVVLTGQSLGGGLAAAASMVNEVPAVTFNAAGVHDNTIERYGIDARVAKREANDGLVRQYVVQNDILTHLQERTFPLNLAMPDAVGARIVLPDPDPLTTFEKLLPWKVWKHRVDMHYIEAVMEAMDKSGQTLPGASEATMRAVAPSPALDTANRLLGDAVDGLSRQRDALGLRDDARFFNAAASIADGAGRDGLRRIDHLVPANAGVVVAIDGPVNDPRHHRIAFEIERAASIPVEEGTARLRAQAQPALEPDANDALKQENLRRAATA